VTLLLVIKDSCPSLTSAVPLNCCRPGDRTVDRRDLLAQRSALLARLAALDEQTPFEGPLSSSRTGRSVSASARGVPLSARSTASSHASGATFVSDADRPPTWRQKQPANVPPLRGLR